MSAHDNSTARIAYAGIQRTLACSRTARARGSNCSRMRGNGAVQPNPEAPSGTLASAGGLCMHAMQRFADIAMDVAMAMLVDTLHCVL